VEQELLILYGVIVVSPFVLFLLAIALPVDLYVSEQQQILILRSLNKFEDTKGNQKT
jgi:hypothetical protein